MESEFTLDDLKRICLDSQGYVVGVGVMTSKKDRENNPILDFQYRRFHLSLEDTQQVIRMFQEALDKEVTERFQDGG